jgi:hypothetical protein
VLEKMNIQKYAAHFHDGALINIEYSQKDIILSMESSEMDCSDFDDPVILSDQNTIRGKLHLSGIKYVKLNEQLIKENLCKKYDSGGIVDLQFIGKIISLAVKWSNFAPKKEVYDFSVIEIEAETIWWENIPDLKDPFW